MFTYGRLKISLRKHDFMGKILICMQFGAVSIWETWICKCPVHNRITMILSEINVAVDVKANTFNVSSVKIRTNCECRLYAITCVVIVGHLNCLVFVLLFFCSLSLSLFLFLFVPHTLLLARSFLFLDIRIWMNCTPKFIFEAAIHDSNERLNQIVWVTCSGLNVAL